MVAKRTTDKLVANSPVGKKRKQAADPNTKLLTSVADGIKSASIPSSISDMLVETSQLSLGVFKEERHRFQQEVVEMVGQILQTTLVSYENAVEDLVAKIDEDQKGKSKTEEILSEAEGIVAAKGEDVKTAKYTLAEHAAAYKAAKSALIAAQMEQERAEKALQEATAKKALLEDTFREEGKPLTDGSLAEEQMTATVAKLMTTLRKFDFDTSMMTALPTALNKAPSTRGEFDVLVVAQLEEEVKKRVVAFDETLQAGEATTKKLTESFDAAKGEITRALQDLKSKGNLFKEALSAKEACDTSVNNAKKELKTRTAELKKRIRDCDAARAEAELFQAGPLAAFAELRELTAPANDVHLETLVVEDGPVQETSQEVVEVAV